MVPARQELYSIMSNTEQMKIAQKTVYMKIETACLPNECQSIGAKSGTTSRFLLKDNNSQGYVKHLSKIL